MKYKRSVTFYVFLLSFFFQNLICTAQRSFFPCAYRIVLAIALRIVGGYSLFLIEYL